MSIMQIIRRKKLGIVGAIVGAVLFSMLSFIIDIIAQLFAII